MNTETEACTKELPFQNLDSASDKGSMKKKNSSVYLPELV